MRRMKLAVTVHHVRLGPVEFKVVRPAEPPARAVLLDRDRHVDACLDQDAAYLIGGLWTLAASSPRSLVHLPIRGNHAPARGLPEAGARQLDLVLLHHSLQFAPARWKELRARLGPGRPQTVTLTVSGPALTGASPAEDEARHHRENRDLFHEHLHAETLFMTGSTKVFRATAHHFFDVARYGPGHMAAHPRHGHFCSELHTTAGVLGAAREIHIEYCDRWRPHG
ncbi:hypothetical protein Snoj_20320 [Streptomyces nojiriensis]|uniref:Uncharacterized protein n=1 Tax=Streptomyces nojiriensis TaxID=66374 RepID=A0ABQ3SIY5_9ACTN|nr:hypothetical protein [Streptomyces nojiriensis]QTI49721.1 hypothetical protein JYK04_07594 [Streptomyces nojiriensis]GGS19770.1 hypothetical protein GCM10010205_57100 [Streptomyces nojiriensis]GHI68114.1 hypothetical protein Snoj_20320 [Streptomyces nojiriensis]